MARKRRASYRRCDRCRRKATWVTGPFRFRCSDHTLAEIYRSFQPNLPKLKEWCRPINDYDLEDDTHRNQWDWKRSRWR